MIWLRLMWAWLSGPDPYCPRCGLMRLQSDDDGADERCDCERAS